MKVLVTGGAGFIGKRLIPMLQELGMEVIVMDSFVPNVHGSVAKPTFAEDIKVINDDIVNIGNYERTLASIDWIFHLASETGTGESMYQITRYTTTNTLGTAKLIEFFARFKPDAGITLTSSRSVYGEGAYRCSNGHVLFPSQDKTPFYLELPHCKCGAEAVSVGTAEDATIKPTSVYAATKYMQEMLLNLSHFQRNKKLSIFRFQNVYGSGQSIQNPYTGILAIFTREIANSKDITLFEQGDARRDFVHVDDVARVVTKLFDKNVILNVGTGIPVKVIEVAEKICDYYGVTYERIQKTDFCRKGDIFSNFADTSKLGEYYPVEEMTQFPLGIREFLDNLDLDELSGDSSYKESINELFVNNLLKEVSVDG